MAEPDCDLCSALGYRACEGCGAPIFSGVSEAMGGRDLESCSYCDPLARNGSGTVEPGAVGAEWCAACLGLLESGRLLGGLCDRCQSAGWTLAAAAAAQAFRAQASAWS